MHVYNIIPTIISSADSDVVYNPLVLQFHLLYRNLDLL